MTPRPKKHRKRHYVMGIPSYRARTIGQQPIALDKTTCSSERNKRRLQMKAAKKGKKMTGENEDQEEEQEQQQQPPPSILIPEGEPQPIPKE